MLVLAGCCGLAWLIASNLSGGESKIERRIVDCCAIGDPDFVRQLGLLLGAQFLAGNRIEALHNGDEIFPPMLTAIRAASVSITFETYIFWSGAIGTSFAQALAEAARRNVAVHVLLDWVGSARMDAALISTMVDAGVEVQRFHPPSWLHLGRLNNRTHRKLLVVDGRMGFTGGVGIAPQWTGSAQDPTHWRDSHFAVEGPVVGQLQSVFVDNWIKVTGTVLHGRGYFPVLAEAGTAAAQMFASSPSGGSDSMQLLYLLTVAAARRSIDISAAYFVPDALTMRALVDALGRGVVVRIVVPGDHIDSGIVRRASRAKWGPLLQSGATIAEYAPTMYHCKAMVVDGLLTSVGSTNFDNRSFRLNDEATLNVFDAPFAREQTAAFEADLARSHPVSLAEWRARPATEQVRERLAVLVGLQL